MTTKTILRKAERSLSNTHRNEGIRKRHLNSPAKDVVNDYPWMDIKALARHLKCSEATIHRLIKAKVGFPVHRLGEKLLRFDRRLVDRWLLSRGIKNDGISLDKKAYLDPPKTISIPEPEIYFTVEKE